MVIVTMLVIQVATEPVCTHAKQPVTGHALAHAAVRVKDHVAIQATINYIII